MAMTMARATTRARVGVYYDFDTGNMGLLGTSQDSPWHAWTLCM